MKSLAEFKRAIKVGVKIKTIHHLSYYGRDENGEPIYEDKDLGIREISIAQSNSFAMSTVRTNGDIVDSWCAYPKASECTFKDGTITILEEQRNGTKVPVLSYTLIN